MSRVFLDANVLFSASIAPDGRARAIFEFAEERATLLATEYVVEEARRNLERKRPSKASELETLLEAVHISDAPPNRLVEELTPLVPDADDAPVLAGAVSGGADMLVTGNERDFRDLYGTEVRGVLVLRPKDALDLLAQ
ncbi:MAG: PIN domain-containing protein [Rubrobacteraceae bacterium]